MVISNKKKATALKRLFFLTSLVMAIIMLIMFIRDENKLAILTGAAFAVWLFVFQLFDLQYIEFIYENRKITLRYYPAIKFGKKEYSSIEFNEGMLHDARFEKTMFGIVTDLTILVKTKRGIAEYPSVSLAAASPRDRKQLKQTFNKILNK